MSYSPSIERLVAAFSRLPSVGRRTAERFVFYLLKSGKRDVAELTNALKKLIENVKSCDVCQDFSDQSPCRICADKTRDASTICVIAEPQDLQAIERTGEYHGLYHLLRGTIQPDDEESINMLKVNELIGRLKDYKIGEIILALNHDLSGETTMMFLEKKLKEANPQLTITRLARGLPMGSDMQYADEITLGSALKHRTKS